MSGGEPGSATNVLLIELDKRFTRFEERIDERLGKIEEKIDARSEWEKHIELRIAALEGGYRLAVWILGIVVVILITGGLSLIWSLITGQIRLVP